MSTLPARRASVMPVPLSRAAEATSYLETAIARMVQSREHAPDCGTFAFTAPQSGAGVTHVVEQVAVELARRTGEAVLIAPSSALDGVTSRDLLAISRLYTNPTRNVWRVLGYSRADTPRGGAADLISIATIPHSFGYMLVDCPALDTAPHVLSLGPHLDGVFLVVAAGETTRSRIVHARRLLDASAVQLVGVILNKRTYPVPNFLYRFFS
jgi:hypothetical protein